MPCACVAALQQTHTLNRRRSETPTLACRRHACMNAVQECMPYKHGCIWSCRCIWSFFSRCVPVLKQIARARTHEPHARTDDPGMNAFVGRPMTRLEQADKCCGTSAQVLSDKFRQTPAGALRPGPSGHTVSTSPQALPTPCYTPKP